jgi:hypothetical protein
MVDGMGSQLVLVCLARLWRNLNLIFMTRGGNLQDLCLQSTNMYDGDSGILKPCPPLILTNEFLRLFDPNIDNLDGAS